MYTEDELLPLSALVDIVFCERRAALHQLERIWEENLATTQGHILHDKAHSGETETRGDTVTSRGLLLRSFSLGLVGKADVVEFQRLSDESAGVVLSGRAGRWLVFPVEYKRGILRHESSFEVQLCAHAICLEEMMNCSVTNGAIFYGISRRRQDIQFSESLRHETRQAAERLHALFNARTTPPALYEKKCERCSMIALCLPETAGRGKSAKQYLAHMLTP